MAAYLTVSIRYCSGAVLSKYKKLRNSNFVGTPQEEQRRKDKLIYSTQRIA